MPCNSCKPAKGNGLLDAACITNLQDPIECWWQWAAQREKNNKQPMLKACSSNNIKLVK
jgi:hypothetical protein